MKYLFLIWQDITAYYGSYDSAVVVAESEEEAKRIHPGNRKEEVAFAVNVNQIDEYWCYLEDVQVKKIGIADESQYNEKVICASFNAG